MAFKFDFLRKLAPKAAEKSLENAQESVKDDLAGAAALENLKKKEAEGGATEAPEATAEAEKDAPAAEETPLEIDPDGLAELLTDIVTRLEAREAKETKEVDLAPVQEGFDKVAQAFEAVAKERDELAAKQVAHDAELAALKQRIETLDQVVKTLTGELPRSTVKEFAIGYRASQAAQTVATKEETKDVLITDKAPEADALSYFFGPAR